MSGSARSELTQILIDVQADKVARAEAADRIFSLVYDELRQLAGGLMRRERPDHTLQATALVNEAYCRLVDQTRIEWESRAHFFGVAARAMRQILVDHARERAAAKRGGDWQRVTLDEQLGVAAPHEVEVLDLDRALSKLAEMDERMARIVELRVFTGLTAEEVAQVLGVSRRTVQGDWKVAKLWLARELCGREESRSP
jgi:RNA polymerase sigma factor (TIGR02999 family)